MDSIIALLIVLLNERERLNFCCYRRSAEQRFDNMNV